MGETLASSGLGEEVVEALEKSFSDVSSMATEGILAALPFGLGVMGLSLGIRIAINFFKGIAG